MKYEIPRGHLSASAIGTLLRCPRQYEFRYVKGVIIPPGKTLATGSIFHKTFEMYYEDAMASRERLTPPQTSELSMSVMDEWLQANDHTVTREDRRDIESLLRNLIPSYIELIGKKIVPLAVEKRYTYTARCGVEILMFLDLLHKLENGEIGIGDYKVTSKKWGLGNLANSLQFNIYAIGTGFLDIQIHNLIKSKGKKLPSLHPSDGITDYATNLRVIRHTFNQLSVDHFEGLIKDIAKQISLGVFPPCAPDSWACTPEWCGYWQLCRGRR